MRLTVLCALLLFSIHLSAAEINIVLWNAERMFDVATVEHRAADLRRFSAEFSQADIIVLDEVTSVEVVAAMREQMGLAGYHVACSDFAQDDHDTFNSLEVGIVSRFPLSDVLEYDPSPDNTGGPGEPLERPLVHVGIAGLADATPARGYLVVRVRELGLTVLATHLKSARGQSGPADLENAQQREFVAASMARFVSDTLRDDPSATVLVAGDMNVGETDHSKVGYRLTEDCFEPEQGDLYDDTGALFTAGLVDGLHMASLTAALGQETYDDPQFAGAGPIDRLYVAGAQANDFTLATRSDDTFGSDHFAISTRFLFRGSVPQRAPRQAQPAPPGSPLYIAALLPDPAGLDEGSEWVLLRNTGQRVVTLSGWRLRDKAGHSVTLDGAVAPGADFKVVLQPGAMPLNNGGDTVELVDVAGQVLDRVTYRAGQVLVGEVIEFRR